MNKRLRKFQSTHPCRVRRSWASTRTITAYFNPRTRVGCDPRRRRKSHKHLFQSTHPCRVRRYIPQGVAVGIKFQSTHPCRVRLKMVLLALLKLAFQSTHPCRVRLVDTVYTDPPYDFNPRTRVGCDRALLPEWRPVSDFNPRTRVGCDR